MNIHKSKPHKPESHKPGPKHHKYHKKTVTLFGKKIPIKLAGLIIGVIGITLVSAMTNSIMRNIKESTKLDYIRLVMEDEELLCSNENYSTTYTSFVPIPDITEEMIEEKKNQVLTEIELTTKALNYSIGHPVLEEGITPEEHKAEIVSLQNYLDKLHSQLKRVEAGKRTEFYRSTTPLSGIDYEEMFKYTIDYVSEIDIDYSFLPYSYLPEEVKDKMMHVSPNEPSIMPPIPRLSMITLDKESYAKWIKKLGTDLEQRQEAIEDIKDLKCLESLSFPRSNPIPQDNIDEGGAFGSWAAKPGEEGVFAVNYEEAANDESREYFGGPIDLAPLTKFVNLKILDLGGLTIETKYKNRGSKFTFKNMPNLRILKIGGIDRATGYVIGGIDRTCEEVKPDKRGKPDYYHDRGGIPDYTPPCSPDEYYNRQESVETIKKPEYPNSSTRPVRRYDNIYAKCGSDISALKELKHLRRLEVSSVLWGFDVLQNMDLLKHLTVDTLGPIDLSGYSIKPKIGVVKEIKKPDYRQPKQLKETIPEDIDDITLDYNKFLTMYQDKYFPDLEYLKISGEIYNPSFECLKNLSELYIGVAQRDEEVDFEYLKTFTQLKKLEISAPLPSGFCSSLKTSLTDTDIVCKEKKLKDVPDPYPGMSFVVHRVVDCPKEIKTDENGEGDEDEENRGFKGQKEEEEEKKTMVVNYTTTYRADGYITVKWDVTGDCPHFNDPGEKQEALDARYNEEAELFLHDIEPAHILIDKYSDFITWIPCSVVEYDYDKDWDDEIKDIFRYPYGGYWGGGSTLKTETGLSSDSFSYRACVNGQCTIVDGKGKDQCVSNADCNFHWACVGDRCVMVSGEGDNQCASNADCGGVDDVDDVGGVEGEYLHGKRMVVGTYKRKVLVEDKEKSETWGYRPAISYPPEIYMPTMKPFNYDYNEIALKDRHGSKLIAVCDIERFEREMWDWEYGFFDNSVFGWWHRLNALSIQSEDGEDDSWIEVTFNSLGLTFRIPYSWSYHDGYFGYAGIFANTSTGPLSLNEIEEYALEQKKSGGGEKSLPDFAKIYQGEYEGFKDLTPILISPGDGAVVSRNEPVTFTWEMPKGADLSNVVCSWHATIDGEPPPWGAGLNGGVYAVDGVLVDCNGSFTYMPSNPADSSIKTAEDGTWEWNVSALVPGEGSYHSEHRTLTWRDEEDDEKDTEKDLDDDLTPILLSPDNRVEVHIDEPVVFAWQLPDDVALPSEAKYYWHIKINGQEPSWYEKQWSIDVGGNTSFVYTPDIHQLRTGTWDPEIWEWNVVVVVPGKESYWSEARILILQKNKEDEEDKEDKKDDKDLTPVLISPNNRTIVPKDEPIKFTWRMPTDVDSSGITYFWDVTINGEPAPWGIPEYGINTHSNASFTYMPSDTFGSSVESGTWEWRVIAFVLGEGVYSSKTRTLTWQEDDEDEEEVEDLTPRLLSPGNGAVVPIDESIVFTWELPDDVVLPPEAKYYWHVEINGIKKPFVPGDQYNIDVGSNASFIYSPDVYPLEVGTWEWSVVTVVPEKENYWSGTRTLTREGHSS